jgi:beta-phosphoglucomutase-like phosphatase (HAD superfamily)
MKWYFGENGWPTSNVLGGRAPQNEEEQTKLIDTIQDWKTDKYKDIIGSGSISPREGVLELMDQARQAGVPIAVCSASTKQATDFVLPNLLGQDRFSSLDVYMAGDDVPRKKPDPIIYNLTSEKLGVAPGDCLVIEDSLIGLQAAVGAGMRCLITYTGSTEGQEFPGAETVLANLGGVEFSQLINGALIGKDDRKGNSNSGGNGRSGEKVIDGVSVSETPDGTLVFKF